MTPSILPRMRRRLLPPLAAVASAVAALAIPLAIAADGADTPPRADAAAAVSKLRCFGAPTRDTVKPCRNPALATKVFPKPDDALLYPNAECDPIAGSTPYQCTFGVPLARAEGTIALVGDSHATHWRSALQTVAEKYRWQGVSMTRSGCPFSTAEPDLPGKLKQECLAWRRQVYDWFEANPQARTVFLSQYAGNVKVPAGSTERRTQVRGFREAWRALPDTVKHIVIIRDTPYVTARTPDCIKRAMRARQDAGLACALPRRTSLKRDYAAEATRGAGIPGLRLIDMTSFMCGDESCYPVVGGALTHKDIGHITLVFGRTMGPYLLRKVRALGIKI